MKRLLFALLLLTPVSAWAQGYQRVPSCGQGSPPVGTSAGYMDANGNICTNSTSGGGGAVTIADGADVTQGAKADAAYAGSGAATLVALLKGIYNALVAALPAGTNLIGKVGIDQTTPGTTNGVQVNAALPAGTNLLGKTGSDQTTNGTTNNVTIAPTSATAVGITPVVSGSAEATHVLKNGAGNLYSVYATNLTSTPGFLTVVNATSAPADGAITPLACVPLPAGGNAALNYTVNPAVYSTGITAVITSATTCFTKTTGVITGFISGAIE